MVTYYSRALNDTSDYILLRLVTSCSMCVMFHSRDDIADQFETLKANLLSCLFCYANVIITKSTGIEVAEKFLKMFSSVTRPSNIPTVRLLFRYDLDSDEWSPALKLVILQHSLRKLKFTVDVLCFIPRATPPEGLHSSLCDAVNLFLSTCCRAVLDYWSSHNSPPKELGAYHYLLGDHLLTIFYSKKTFQDVEHEFRMEVHKKLNLPVNAPLLRRGQALHPIPYLRDWLGPNDHLLVCPHEELRQLPGTGSTHIVQGRYTYKHYMQDEMDDKNWGCAYRSLQTLISWLMWQGEIEPRRLPSLSEIQSCLVRIGDKPKGFVGSRQWIGSLEVSFCLQAMYNVQCRILPVSRGADMGRCAASQLAQHFTSGGGPVMIGGGQLAHTIIGVQLPNTQDDDDDDRSTTPRKTPRFLVLDPHFMGPTGRLKIVLDKGWCGWKEESFWKPQVHYNLCFLPPIKAGRL